MDSYQTQAGFFRYQYLKMVQGSREALIPSAFSIIDLITYLFLNDLILNKEKVDIIISKGHAASVLYPFISEKHSVQLNYSKDGSPYGIYANVEIPSIYMPSGSLGHGLGVAAGFHISQNPDYKTYVILGDGECFEGSIWEALNIISNLKLYNVIPVIDYNNRTILGDLDGIYSNYNLSKKVEGFGFKTIIIDGHDFSEIDNSIKNISSSNENCVLFMKTIKGKGIKMMESSHLWHNKMPNASEFNTILKEFESQFAK